MEADKETKSIDINVQSEIVAALEKHAASIHLSSAEYCSLILARWIVSGQKLKLSEL